MSMIKSLHQFGWSSRARFGREAPALPTTQNRGHDERLASNCCAHPISDYVLEEDKTVILKTRAIIPTGDEEKFPP